MLPRLITRSLRHRPGRALLIVLTLIMSLSLEAALLSLAMDIGEKNERELTAFGSNILLLPKDLADPAVSGQSLDSQGHIDQSRLTALDGPVDFPLAGYAPFLYNLADVNGRQIVITGTDFAQALKINPWWSVEGEIPVKGSPGAILGKEAAAKLGLKAGDSLTVKEGNTATTLTLTGILVSGGSEDSQLMMELDQAQSISGLTGKVSVVEVSVLASEYQNLDRVAASLDELVPGARAKAVKQVAEAGQNLLGKISLLMGLVTTLIIFISGLTVSASLANAVMERRREIGLMKSLGADGRVIVSAILGEALVLGAVAGPGGYLLGLVLAQAIGLSVFDTTVSIHLPVIPIVIISSGVLAFMASLMPVRRALSMDPVVILRGE
ncbi:MAG: ABC transporter permease [Thermoleophilia bacterium]